jgi:endonuclease YncB( thermonuclease family)
MRLSATIVACVTMLGCNSNHEYAGKSYAIDGDTIVIGDEIIRIEGIDAPEIDQTCNRYDHNYDCGKEARQVLENLLQGGTPKCASSSRDIYNRHLGVCSVNSIDIGQHMVLVGYAVNYYRYTERYAGDETIARVNRRGMWAGTFTMPWEHRRYRK